MSLDRKYRIALTGFCVGSVIVTVNIMQIYVDLRLSFIPPLVLFGGFALILICGPAMVYYRALVRQSDQRKSEMEMLSALGAQRLAESKAKNATADSPKHKPRGHSKKSNQK